MTLTVTRQEKTLRNCKSVTFLPKCLIQLPEDRAILVNFFRFCWGHFLHSFFFSLSGDFFSKNLFLAIIWRGAKKLAKVEFTGRYTRQITALISWLRAGLAPRPLLPHTHFGSKHTSARGTFRPKEHTSAPIILWPNVCFGPEILWPKTTSAQYTSTRGPNFQLLICPCCCMPYNSRLENVPRFKMLFHEG